MKIVLPALERVRRYAYQLAEAMLTRSSLRRSRRWRRPYVSAAVVMV